MTVANTGSPAVEICCCLGPILILGLLLPISIIWHIKKSKKVGKRRDAMAQFATQTGLPANFEFKHDLYGMTESFISGVYRGRNLEILYRKHKKGTRMGTDTRFAFIAQVSVSDPDFKMYVWQKKLTNMAMAILPGVVSGIKLGARKEGVEYAMSTSDVARAKEILSGNAGWKADELLSETGLPYLNLQDGHLYAQREDNLQLLEFDAPSLRRIADGLCDIAEAVEKSSPSPAPETAPADGPGPPNAPKTAPVYGSDYSPAPETSF